MPRIVQLEITNVLGIKHLELTDLQQVTVVSGSNRQGKTSVPEAIIAAFTSGGKCPDLIHNGEEGAEILVKLDDDVTVRRTITEASGSVARVTKRVDADTEAIISKPQAYLAGLYGDPMRFRPLDFSDLPAAKQRELLMGLMPIEVTREELIEWFASQRAEENAEDGAEAEAAEADEEQWLGIDFKQHGLQVVSDTIDLIYDRRKAANTVLKERKDRAAAMAVTPPDGFDEAAARAADVSALQQEIKDAGEVAERKRHAQATLAEAVSRIAALDVKIAELQASRSDIAAQIEKARTTLVACTVPDVTDAEEHLAKYTTNQATIAKLDDASAADVLAAEAQADADALAAQLEAARALPEKLLAAADVPFEGLALTSDGATLNGVPIERLSESEKLELGVRIACALAGELKLVCIDGAEKLDPARWSEMLQIMAGYPDVQFWVTKVTDEPELTVTTGGPGMFLGDAAPEEAAVEA